MEYITVYRNLKFAKIEAKSKKEAEKEALENEYLPLITIKNYLRRDKALSNKEAANFFESLSFLFKSTGSLAKSLFFLEGRFDKIKTKFHYQNKIRDFIDSGIRKITFSRFKRRLALTKDIRQKLEQGHIMSAVLKEHNFDEICVGLIEAGEKTGDFVKIFKMLSDYYTAKEKYSKGMIKELAYPFLLIVFAFISFLIFIFYIIPAFAKFFKGLKIAQSTLTVINIFMNIKHYFAVYGAAAAVIATGLVALWSSNYKNIRGHAYERLASIPAIGYFFRFFYLKWYLYEMSILIASGDTYIKIARYLLDNVKNEFFKNKFTVIYLYLSGGSTLTESLSASDLLRPEDLDRVASAEISANLDETFLLISEEYGEIVDLQIKVMNKSFNYLALIFIAGFIIFVFTGIYLPMIKGMMSLSAS